ncbi:hypothetical protein FACS1894187_04830 [Synergistales bacterium]|nr:hypothetical protein FACS1894187_04830 [Synergistales bacterium]
MRYEIENFSRSEFLCPCCGKGETAALLALWCDLLRKSWGDPVIVNSGWRCERHNKEVGGAAGSRHKIGCAADIRTTDAQGRRWLEFVALAEGLCRVPGFEFRVYKTFVHMAVPREESVRPWNGGVIII